LKVRECLAFWSSHVCLWDARVRMDAKVLDLIGIHPARAACLDDVRFASLGR